MMAAYDVRLVVFSILTSIILAYIAIDLGFRVRNMTNSTRKLWWTGGAIAIGLGIYSIQYIATTAISLQPHDYQISYSISPPLLVIAIAIANLALLALPRVSSLVDRHLQIEAATAEAQRQSEQRFRSLVQNSSDIITILDPDGTIGYISPSVTRILGYKPEEIIDRNAFEYIHPEDVTSVKTAFTSASQNPLLTVTIEYRVKHAKGHWIYLESVTSNLLENPSIKGIVANSRNISKRKQAEETLQQIEQKYRSIFENAVEGIFQTTPDGRYITVNPMLARIYGYDSPEELIATITDIKYQLYVDPNRRAQFKQILQENDTIWGFESQVYRKDGKIIWISESARAIRNDRGELLGYEGTVVDISQRKKAEAELHNRDRLLEGIASAMTYLLTNTDYATAMNDALNVLGLVTGVDRIYIEEQHPQLKTGEPPKSIRFEWLRTWETENRNQIINKDKIILSLTEETETIIANKNHQNLQPNFDKLSCYRFPTTACLECHIPTTQSPLSQLIVPIFVDDKFWGNIAFEDRCQQRQWSIGEESILTAMAASIGGALKRQMAEATIKYQAFHDLLTGLPNRTLLNYRLSSALDNAQQFRNRMAVMFLDLDRFKTINDTLGHAVGDKLLQYATQRLKACLRSNDTIARWGGDEFTLLLPEINSIEDATKIAQRIIEVLKPAFNLEGHQLYITSSIGIAVYPQHGEDGETLLKNADAALYRAKAEGRNNYQIYAPAMNSQASELLELENYLHQAIENQEFALHYQPQVNFITGKISRMEALLRWHHPQKGEIPPKTFIPLAEETGLILSLGNWVLRTACKQNKAWQNAGLPPIRIAVNLSVRQLQQPRFVDSVAQILAETELAPEFLELEITETAMMQNPDFTKSMLKRLVEMGCHITLDDFGTGYSSLNYLKNFPLHTLKIDRSFVQDLTVDSSDAAIINTIVALGRGLNLSVVAEGVETIEQLEYLKAVQCHEMQGYLFSHPLPVQEAANLLSGNSNWSLV